MVWFLKWEGGGFGDSGRWGVGRVDRFLDFIFLLFYEVSLDRFCLCYVREVEIVYFWGDEWLELV